MTITNNDDSRDPTPEFTFAFISVITSLPFLHQVNVLYERGLEKQYVTC